MDDKTFDQKAALDWINSIETGGESHRDDDVYTFRPSKHNEAQKMLVAIQGKKFP